MVNNFKNSFGEDSIIVFGDWEQKKHMKFKEPTKGKGMREVFRKAGFKVYLADEFRTSCRCNQCEGETEKFKYNEKGYLIHGLLRCKTCDRKWNRDLNGSSNIHLLGISAPHRPEYLTRNHVMCLQRTTLLIHHSRMSLSLSSLQFDFCRFRRPDVAK